MKKLTPAMKRELLHYANHYDHTTPDEWLHAGNLWYHVRDRVIGALEKRGLIANGKITEAGMKIADEIEKEAT